jgi:hypothetical protein
MSEEKILSNDQTENNTGGTIIASESTIPIIEVNREVSSLKDRIAISTESGGLKQLPDRFDEQNGDWITINSTDPFEVLYLDYKLYKFISPEIVIKSYTILESFWREKIGVMNTGGNRVAFKNKYREGTVENSLQKLKKSLDKLNSKEGIEQYFIEINIDRLKKGEENLRDSIENMVMDGSADKPEIQLCLERGLKYGLSHEETANIIRKTLDEGNFKPYGNVSGNSLIEQLLSVEHWMTQQKIDEADRLKKERDSLKIQILPGKYATSIEEIGNILFEDPQEAKEIIKEDLLKQVIAQKDIVLAREIGNISKGTKNIDAAFLEIVYKLNPLLPFRFSKENFIKTAEELVTVISENESNLKLGKEYLQKGYIEIWLKETNKQAYEKFIKIRDSAKNIDIAFLEFIYTFNATLPYRFSGKILIKTPEELSIEINKNAENWEAGKNELFNSSIIVWLRLTSKTHIVEKWENIKNNYKENKDVGTEVFLHLLNNKIIDPYIKVDQNTLTYPKIQSGKLITTVLTFRNDTRGYVNGNLALSKELKGVTLSSEKLVLNVASGINNQIIIIKIDTTQLVKGVNYETNIQLETSIGQKIEIPVSFDIVFPKTAFILEIVKYAGIVATLFIVMRLIITSSFSDWLKRSFDFYLNWDIAYTNPGNFALFGWTFFLFLIAISFGMYFLIKYLIKK